MPHLVLWGKYDTVLLPQSYTSLTEQFDNITIIEVTDSDHCLHNQVPEELSKAIFTSLSQ